MELLAAVLSDLGERPAAVENSREQAVAIRVAPAVIVLFRRLLIIRR
ncbi:hypothetical protein [Nonomuraea sp. NPDC049625]